MELETAIAEIDKSNTENPDPRLDAVIKILKLLGKLQKNLTSAMTDSCRVAATAAAPAASAASSYAGRKPQQQQQPTVEEVNEKKLKTVLREAEKKRSFSTWI
jgi:ribosomal protein L12E/L44/L45/RPP1/RPP2